MWIKSFQVINYKSFDDSEQHTLARHMNVIVGQNNVGKTALLKAIAQRLEPHPHNNSSRRRGVALSPISRVDLDFISTSQEIRDIIMLTGQIPVPVPEKHRTNPLEFLDVEEVTTVSACYRAVQGQVGWIPSRFPSNGIDSDAKIRVTFGPNEDRTALRVDNVGALEAHNDFFGAIMGTALSRNTYLFNALRAPLPQSTAGSNHQLVPDAQNLAEVLSTFQPNPYLYRQYISQVRRVLPLVKWVDARPVGNNNVEIRVWNVDPESARDDLANALPECGTGVGQVLAILYVVIRSSGSIICIDEPNSFLHPGAAKALMAILNEHKEHQYIISTHSPEIISSANPERLFMLNYINERTTIKSLDRLDIVSARQMLDEIGSRFSDVFGADSIIWVEGPTEVECFLLLVTAIGRQLPVGTIIAHLRSTGDLEGKHAQACADIYRNLSSAGSILPVNITISLDGDKKSNSKVDKLKTVFGEGKLHFLPRRMYECYLLHPRALADLLNTLPTFSSVPTNSEHVETWIRAEGHQAKYGASAFTPLSPEWLAHVDAARLLDDLFQSISSSKEIYRKIPYSALLTQWLIENDIDSLNEVVDYVSALVST